MKKKWGENMIKISVKFWTDHLPLDADEKTALARGVIYVVAIKSRGIKPKQIHFNSMEEFFPKLQKLLKDSGIKLIKPPEKFTEVDLTKISISS